MTALMATTGFSSNPLWYITRATAIVAFLLLTIGTVLGVAATQRTLASPLWPRFATQLLHRNVNLLALAFVAAHIVTTLLDTYVTISVVAVLVPFSSAYRPLPVALGTLTLDLLLLVAITGLIRIRMRERIWRIVHWAAYLAWPLAFGHFILTGTDGAFGRWGFWLAVVCALAVAAAAFVRVNRGSSPQGPVRSVAGAR